MTASLLQDHDVDDVDDVDPGLSARVQRLVEDNMAIAKKLASRYANRGIAANDLEQIAYVGLLGAARRYDPERGDDFLAFAVPTIRGELRKAFRDLGWVVRPPRRLQELQARIWKSEGRLEQELGRSPRPSEIAEELGVDVDEVIEALSVDGCFRPSSLDMPAGIDDATATIGDRLGDTDPDFELTDARILLGPAVRALSERDRQILELRFFQGWTQAQIGEEIGVTQMQVSRLLKRILEELRAAIDGAAA